MIALVDEFGSQHFHLIVDKLEGDQHCLVELKIILNYLVVDLASIPSSRHGKAMLPFFKKCILSINNLDVHIETVERDSLLDVIYQLGELVGLPRESQYLEEWRGDW